MIQSLKLYIKILHIKNIYLTITLQFFGPYGTPKHKFYHSYYFFQKIPTYKRNIHVLYLKSNKQINFI